MEPVAVLLIDDEKDFVATLAERLQLRGFETKYATDGSLGLQMILAGKFQVVVLDILMPNLGGLEVLKQIKAVDPRLPVILLTGHGDEKEGIRGKQAGAVSYLMKPVAIEDLIAKIQQAAGGTQAASDLP